MLKEGKIMITTHHIENAKDYYTYEHTGGTKIPVAGFLLCRLRLDGQKTIRLGQYKLRLLDHNPIGDYYWYQLIKSPFSYILIFVFRIGIFLDMIYRRIILSLWIWGLADRDEWVSPSWRNIKLVKKLKEWKDKRDIPRPA